MEAAWWLIVAIGALACELLAPGMLFFIAISSGAGCAALSAWYGYELSTQCGIAFAGAIVSFFSIRAYADKVMRGRATEETGVYGMLGMRVVIVERVGAHAHERGVVRVGGELWSAASADGRVYDIGVEAHVVAVRGNHLVIQ